MVWGLILAIQPGSLRSGVAAQPRRAQPSHGRGGGVPDSLDEAKAAFRAAWEGGLDRRCTRPRPGQRLLSPEKAEEICSA